jgi:hypothetical protein
MHLRWREAVARTSVNTTWLKLRERYDDKQILDIICAAGRSTLVSTFLSSAGVQLQRGRTGIPR